MDGDIPEQVTKNDRPALLGSNWVHYFDAFRIMANSTSPCQDNTSPFASKGNVPLSVPLHEIRTAKENMLEPTNGFFCFYSDLLGFSAEMKVGGPDSLPDFYGAAFVGARSFPQVKVYLLSDSCIAFASKHEVSSLIDFVSFVVSNWRADGMLPQCSIGYGTFVERKPDLGPRPQNFFGFQVSGTALVDAVEIQKKSKLLGSRILVTHPVAEHFTHGNTVRLLKDGEGYLELLPGQGYGACLFDCLYYLLCLRTLETGSRLFDHYIFSIASRIIDGGRPLLDMAVNLARPYFDESNLGVITSSVIEILEAYQIHQG